MQIKSINVGDRAPDFRLKNYDGKSVHLADFRGKKSVVLFFYPGDFTPGCTVQLCAIRDDWKKFEDAGVVVYGTTRQKGSARYGAVRSLFLATVIRRTVVGIDQSGIIRYLKHGMPKNAEILKAMTK